MKNSEKKIIVQNEVKVSKKLLALRDKFRNKKKEFKIISSTVFEKNQDLRPFGKVFINGISIVGLMDSGANISCLGKNGLEFLEKLNLKDQFIKIDSKVRTAGGRTNTIIGKFIANIKYKNTTKDLTIYVAPQLEQELYLGINFWKAFDICPSLISEIDLGIDDEENVDHKAHELSDEEKQRLDEVKDKFQTFEKHGLGRTSLVEHEINTQLNDPVKQKLYPYSPNMQKLVEEEINRMISLQVIEECQSPWNSPICLVRKPKKNRICLDARKLNAITVKNAYPIHNIEGLLSRLRETKYITSIDLKDAFWQIPLTKSSREKTAFSLPNGKQYQFKYMPFGLCNAPQTMCALMNKIFPAELRNNVLLYLDDLLIVSNSFDEHIKLLETVAAYLKSAGLSINLKKSNFCYKELKYLGFIVSDGHIKPDPEKVAAIEEFPKPKSAKQVRRFLGLAGWYRKFIRNYADLSAPISDCLKKAKRFCFTPKALKAFEILKNALISAPILANADFSLPFVIQCDASSMGVGGVLYQIDLEGNEKVLYYYSKKLNKAQRSYSVTELECMAALLCINKFRPYIELHPFKVITDHASLKWLMSQSNLSGRLARWSLRLQSYDFQIEHRRGSLNVVPDSLSRVHMDGVELDILSLDKYKSEYLGVDLSDVEFKDVDYIELRRKVEEDPQNYPDVRIIDQYVFKKLKFSRDVSDECWKLWVPYGLREKLIVQAHDPPPVSHGGTAKTLHRLRVRYFWPRMAVDVEEYVKKCDRCKCIKAPNLTLRAKMGKQFIADRAFQHLYADLIGPYPRSTGGNIQALVILDQYSKYIFIEPLKKATSEKIINFMEKTVFSYFGTPEKLFTDNGVQFVSKEFKSFLSSNGIKRYNTGLYAPQANASERSNRTILAAIRAYLKQQQKDWDKNLHHIAAAIRSSFHQAIETTPYKALFGVSMIQHGSEHDLQRKLDLLNDSDKEPLLLSDKISLLRKKIMLCLKEAHEKYENSYNLRSRDIKYNAGQIVYKRQFIQSDKAKGINAKLCDKFQKCVVKNNINNVLYELEDEHGKTLGTFHTKDLYGKPAA